MKQENNLYPNIRFKGFEGAWERRELSTLGKFSKGKGYSKKDLISSGIPIILYGELYTNYKLIIEEAEHYVSFTKGSVCSQGGEVIIPASGETEEDLCRASVIKNPNIIIGGDLNIIQVNKFELNSLFLATLFLTSELKKQVIQKSQGKSVVHIRNKDLKKLTVTIPKIEEQSKISTHLLSVEKLIDLYVRKLELIGLIKKGLLQKLFVKNNCKYPEIRFKEFNDAWEKQKLKDLAKIVSGGTPSTKNKKYWDGNINWYTPQEIDGKIFLEESHRKISKEGLSKTTGELLPKGTVLFTSRASIGSSAILKKEASTNQGFQSIVPNKNKLDSYFIYSQIPLIKSNIIKYASGSTFLEISNKNMRNLVINIPKDFSEQKIIGSFFYKCDKLITLYQRKIDLLEALKQEFLKNMLI